jgi:hypothetical protein
MSPEGSQAMLPVAVGLNFLAIDPRSPQPTEHQRSHDRATRVYTHEITRGYHEHPGTCASES